MPPAKGNTWTGGTAISEAKDIYQGRVRNRLINSTARYFRLPDNVRFMVMKHVLQHHDRDDKAIRMNSPLYLQPVWPINSKTGPKRWSTDYFESLETALFSLARYTSVCFAMRAEVLATLFLTRRFHVVYSPIMTERIQPGAVTFMNHFGPLMTSIIIELDFTKQGGEWRPEAVGVNSLPGLRKVAWLLDKFVDQQWVVFPRTTIRDLRVLVRRYHGFRPAAAEWGTNRCSFSQLDPNPDDVPLCIPYTPDSHIAMVLNPLKRLRSLVDNLTITGAPQTLARELILAISGKDHPLCSEEVRQLELDTHCTYRHPARGYPLTPSAGQSSLLDFGPDNGGLQLW
ncbi:hypothetical protein MFIFM68171_07947 [Madurella fahalii]|uniref:Uncharacterized protein n=1 Tax=Madurella fahalii TaxID=1157608 RepID=A0ABQ0GJ02_9PEZI